MQNGDVLVLPNSAEDDRDGGNNCSYKTRKLQSNHHHPATSNQIFTGRMRFLSPTNNDRALNRHITAWQSHSQPIDCKSSALTTTLYLKKWTPMIFRNYFTKSDLSLCFNGHFPGGPGLASTRMSPFCILLHLRMMEVVVTTRAIRHRKLQSKCHHQQANVQFFL